MTNALINHFDREKPFYPLIINYLILLHGIKEFSLRGVLNQTATDFSNTGLLQVRLTRKLEYELGPKITEAIGPIPKDAKIADIIELYISKIFPPSEIPPNFSSLPKTIREVESSIIKIAGPLQLGSKFQNERIEVPLDLIEDEIGSNFSYLISFTLRTAGSLLILAFETTRQYHDNSPLWEFLRHCRNAAAHNGRFHFTHGEPRRLAEWGKFRGEKTLQNTSLFPIDKQTPGFLEAGDAIRLLWDIEQAYPNMQGTP